MFENRNTWLKVIDIILTCCDIWIMKLNNLYCFLRKSYQNMKIIFSLILCIFCLNNKSLQLRYFNIYILQHYFSFIYSNWIILNLFIYHLDLIFRIDYYRFTLCYFISCYLELFNRLVIWYLRWCYFWLIWANIILRFNKLFLVSSDQWICLIHIRLRLRHFIS